ncbi:MAG: hypothetical protein M1828_006744 [Chrysothrix sp. TS-e1954]|nr:MAG: hypothetical protein M1828_006744 [Chrysothrix sp. TS-e1954]
MASAGGDSNTNQRSDECRESVRHIFEMFDPKDQSMHGMTDVVSIVELEDSAVIQGDSHTFQLARDRLYQALKEATADEASRNWDFFLRLRRAVPASQIALEGIRRTLASSFFKHAKHREGVSSFTQDASGLDEQVRFSMSKVEDITILNPMDRDCAILATAIYIFILRSVVDLSLHHLQQDSNSPVYMDLVIATIDALENQTDDTLRGERYSLRKTMEQLESVNQGVNEWQYHCSRRLDRIVASIE